MQYVVKTPIKASGVNYQEGQIMSLTEKEAAPLLALNAIAQVDQPFAAIVKILGNGQ